MKRKFTFILFLFAAAVAFANTDVPEINGDVNSVENTAEAAINVKTDSVANTAVSSINGKIDTAYGRLDSTDAWINGGSFSVPIAEALGVQADALYADIGDTEYGGFGGHFFWRDYEVGLFGIAAGGVWSNDVDTYEISLEGEYYYGMLTFGARAGYASIDLDSGDLFPSLDLDEEGAFGLAYVTAYPLEDLSVMAGLEYRFDNPVFRLEGEFAISNCGLSIFAQGLFANDDYEQGVIGLRYYFGSKKTLQERHRQDDPRNVLKDLLANTFTYRAEGKTPRFVEPDDV